jgi:septal ring factor EnvC (AmiA/AmiB activator)
MECANIMPMNEDLNRAATYGDIQRLELKITGRDQRFDGLDRKIAGHDHRFDALDQKIAGHDHRFDALDRKIAGHDQRFDALDQKIAGHDQRFDSLDKKIDDVHHKLSVEIAKIHGNMAKIKQELSDEIRAGNSRVLSAVSDYAAKVKLIDDREILHRARIEKLERRVFRALRRWRRTQ